MTKSLKESSKIAIIVSIIAGFFTLFASYGTPFIEWLLNKRDKGDETNKTMQAASTNYDKHSFVSIRVNYLYRSAGIGPLKQINNGEVLQSGDHYKIVLIPDETVYLYIFQADSAGQIFQLFPMTNFKGKKINNENPVLKNKTTILPAPDKAFRLDNQKGIERIYLVATKERNKDLEELYANMQKVLKQRRNSEIPSGQTKLERFFQKRGVESIVSDKEIKITWRHKDYREVFYVLEKRIKLFCPNCVHIVEFLHN